MRLHIDTSATRFSSAGTPVPVLDRETRTQKVDDLGRPLFNVGLFTISSEGPDVIVVKVAGEPKGLGEMTPVKVTNLVASTWNMGDRNGVSFKADGIDPVSKTAA